MGLDTEVCKIVANGLVTWKKVGVAAIPIWGSRGRGTRFLQENIDTIGTLELPKPENIVEKARDVGLDTVTDADWVKDGAAKQNALPPGRPLDIYCIPKAGEYNGETEPLSPLVKKIPVNVMAELQWLETVGA